MDRVLKPAVVVVAAAGLAVAFAWLAWTGVDLLVRGDVVRKGFGLGLLLLTAVGAWSTVVIVRDGLQLQRMSRAAAEAGCELDVSGLPHRPSGRIERDAADALFDRVSAEYQAGPDDWRTTYRLARAYDHAGDRARARETMRRAVRLHDSAGSSTGTGAAR